jgi:hypothetical protein
MPAAQVWLNLFPGSAFKIQIPNRSKSSGSFSFLFALIVGGSAVVAVLPSNHFLYGPHPGHVAILTKTALIAQIGKEHLECRSESEVIHHMFNISTCAI